MLISPCALRNEADVILLCVSFVSVNRTGSGLRLIRAPGSFRLCGDMWMSEPAVGEAAA